MMNILIYGLRGESYEIAGGLQLSNTRLANYLVACGHNVVLMSVSETSREQFFYAISSDVKLETLSLPAGMGAFAEYRLRLLDVLDKHNIDVVAVLQSGRLLAYVGMAMQDSDVPLLSTERGEPDFVTSAWGGAFFRSLGFSLSDRIHMLFDAYAATLPEFLQERCRVIPSPIPRPGDVLADPTKVEPGDDLRILYVGRVSFEKDLFTLVRAFAKLRSDGENCRLQIVGDGPALDDVVKEAQNLGVEEWVEFAGQKAAEELAPYFQRAHLFVLPSLAEGCPLSLREAMSFGLPVLASSDSRGCHEILKAGAGRLVARAPEEAEIRMQIVTQKAGADLMPMSRAMRFYKEMKELLNNSALRKSLGEKAYEDVKQYDADLIHHKWEELLKEVASLKGRRPTHKGSSDAGYGQMTFSQENNKTDCPKVSVIVPVYNTSLYLWYCLKSLVSQSLADIEIIIVNDASTDDSKYIIQEFMSRDSRIRYIEHSENRGQLLSRCSGAAVAHGEYIAFCDSDDYVDPHMYLRMYREAIEKDADIVQCYMKRLEDGVVSEYGTLLPYFSELKGEKIFSQFIKFNIQLSLCNKLYKKDLWDKASKLFPSKNLRADDPIQNMYLMYHAQRYVCLKEAFYYYRWVGESITQANDAEAIYQRAYSIAYNIMSFRTFLTECGIFEKYKDDYEVIIHRWYSNYVNKFFKLIAEHKFDRLKANNFDIKLAEIISLNGEGLIRQHCSQYAAALEVLKKMGHGGPKVVKGSAELPQKVVKPKRTKSSMKIICFIPALAEGKGGAERVVVEMSKEMASRGHDMTLVGFTKKEGKPAYDIPTGVQAILMENNADKVRNLVKITAPDIIFAVTSLGVIRYWHSLFAETNIPLVVQEVSSPARITRLWSERTDFDPEGVAVLRPAFMSYATKIRLTMDSYRQSLPAILSKDIYTFPNAVRHAKRKSDVAAKNRVRKKIINIGGLKRNKNIFPFLEAFNGLKDELPDWDIYICGEGDARDSVQEYIDHHLLHNRVYLLGDVDDIYSVYEKCQLHVISSLEEGNPLAVCESMVHSIPSIGYEDCSGTNELIVHERNGLLAKTDDRVEDLKVCMRDLMINNEKRTSLGDMAYEDSDIFSAKQIYDNWEQMFQSAYEYVGDAGRKVAEREQSGPQLMKVYADARENIFRVKQKNFLKRADAAEKGAPQHYDDPLKSSPPRDVSKVNESRLSANTLAAALTSTRSERNGKGTAKIVKSLTKYLAWLRDGKFLRRSALFDEEYYRRIYPDISESGVDPVKHYYFYGSDEGRNPSQHFNTMFYMYMNPDVKKKGINPLLHYIKHGETEGRLPL